MKKRTLTIESRTERLIAVREFISGAAKEFGFSEEDISKIALAVDEACTNIIKHAYKYDPNQSITITVQPHDRVFEVAIRDSGRDFHPEKIATPDMRDYLEHYRRGGLGVYLMRSLMDNVEYDIRPGVANIVRLTKSLP